MSVDEATLVAAIEADPDDESAQLVYMDWLLDRGDRRGTLIQLQLARLRDPDWARARLARRVGRLDYAISGNVSRLFDRGMPGYDVDLLRSPPLDTLDVRWLRPAISNPYATTDEVEAALAALLDSALLPTLRRLDLSSWRLPSWTRLLASSARPTHIVLPIDAQKYVDQLHDAPLFSQVERLELRGSLDATGFAMLLEAPWIANLVHLSLHARPPDEHWWMSRSKTAIGDDGIAALALRAPRLRTLDARFLPVTGHGLRALATSAHALTELHLSADDLDEDAFAVLATSRLSSIARVSIAGAWVTSADAVLRLVRSPSWDGRLDLTSIPRFENGTHIDRSTEILDALAAEPAGPHPLFVLRLGDAPTFPAFAATPFARTLRHLVAGSIGEGPDVSDLRLDSLVLAANPRTLASNLASPAVLPVQRLSLRNLQASTVKILARSAVRPVDLELHGQSMTDATVALVRSPVLERVVDLTLAIEGNHAAKVVTAALLETPYLQDLQHLELDFLSKLPGKFRDAIRGRYGAVLDRTS